MQNHSQNQHAYRYKFSPSCQINTKVYKSNSNIDDKHSAALRTLLRVCLMGVFALLSAFATLTTVTHAQTASAVLVKNAWARATVEGQTVSGAFMTLTAPQDLTLLAVSTPATTSTEIHATQMDNGVMRMRALPNGLPLPAGKAVTLQPGQYHIMLLGLTKTLKAGDTLPLTLHFKDASGKSSSLQTTASISLTAP